MDCLVRKIGGSFYFHIPKTSRKANDIEENDIWQVEPKKLVKRE